MGYESKIYIVRKTTSKGFDEAENKFYAQKIAEFNMCKFPALADSLRYKPITDCYIYADDGNTPIVEDCYGEPLTEATPQFVVECLEKYIAGGGDYYRVYPLLACLKAFEERKVQWGDDLVVLHFGY